MKRLNNKRGFTLIELVIVVLILGVLATVATRQMLGTIEDARFSQTEKEMEQLALAITGNPALYSDGTRTDFGFVGDVGTLPPDLNALVANTGGWATWDGPYIDAGSGPSGHLSDAWGVAYTFTGSLIRSTGSGTTLEKIVIEDSAELTANTVAGFVTDADRQAPAPPYDDSVQIQLLYPDGAGGITVVTTLPFNDGSFSFSGVPLGNHTLRTIYLPDADTTRINVTVLPGRVTRLDISLTADLW